MKERELNDNIQKGAIVLLTGSKFFRGPPFSGAVLVPGSIMERLVRLGLSRALLCPY
jgi:hypothetical protein